MTRVVSQLVLGQNVINFNLLTTKYGVKNNFKSWTHSAATPLQVWSLWWNVEASAFKQFLNLFHLQNPDIKFLGPWQFGFSWFPLKSNLLYTCFFCRDSAWWANMLQVGRDKRAKAKLNQVGVLLQCCSLPSLGLPWQARVSISQWGCSTSCSNLILLPPPSHRWRHLISSFIFTVLRRELFLTNPNWNQGTFSQGFPMNHCCKALEAKLALQRLETDSATEAAFIKANVHQICLLSIFAVLLFFILFFFYFED